MLTARRESELNRTTQLCKEANAEVDILAVTGDVTKEEDVKRLFECSVDKFGASIQTAPFQVEYSLK